MRTAIVLSAVLGALVVGCSKNEKSAETAEIQAADTQPAQTTADAKEDAPDEEAKDPKQAPDNFTVELTTTQGPILIDVHREWSPQGADRFYELVQDGFYTDLAFFRVIAGFMAQTGIHGDPAVAAKWRDKTIADDPVQTSNARGTVSFAMAGPNTRTTQFFINFVDNTRLDSMGFSPFGEVRDMSAADALYNGYGEGAPRGGGPSQGRIQSEGNAYLKKDFPKLDYIKSAKVIENDGN
jgi:peptidyl-prolyl cis-trans isomerase A (cyclophilin A)